MNFSIRRFYNCCKAGFIIPFLFCAFFSPHVYAACATPTASSGARNYNATDDRLEYCDGSDWGCFNITDSASGCTTAGELEYDTTAHQYKYCDGATWQLIDCADSPCDTSIGACTGEAEVQHYSSGNQLVYCDGSDWNVIAPAIKPAPTVVQVSAVTNSGTGVTLTGVTPGNTLVVLLQNSSSTNRTWQTSDDVEGAWTNEMHIDVFSTRDLYAAYFFDHTGGNVTVTTEVVAFTEFGVYEVLEVSGVDEFDTDIGWITYDTDPTNVNPAIPFAPAIDTPNNSITFLTLVNNSTAIAHAFDEAGWVQIFDSTARFSGYRIDATGASGITASVTQGSRITGALGFTLKAGGC